MSALTSLGRWLFRALVGAGAVVNFVILLSSESPWSLAAFIVCALLWAYAEICFQEADVTRERDKAVRDLAAKNERSE